MKTNSFFKRAAIFAIAILAMAGTASAQAGSKAVGANLLLGSGDGYSNIGIGAKFQYSVTDPIRLQAEFDYFLKKDLISMWDLSAYGQYLFPVAEAISVYPEVGLGYVNTSVSFMGVSASAGDFAFSLGGGADYKLADNLTLNLGLRYKINDGGRLNILAGIAYSF
jgi:outer membrane protein X